MDFLAKVYLPGVLALGGAMLFALVSLAAYVKLLGREDDDDTRRFARRAYAFFTLAVLMGAGVLIVLLLRSDFRLEYVSQYSGAELPWFYRFSSFWAGQKGSFLIWLVAGSLLGLPLRKAAGREEAPVMGVYLLTLLGLLFILVRETPFVMLAQTPADGSGLNPLLQDPWMVIHPPIMFTGFAAAAIPFSFAVAALFRRRYDRWAHLAFPWALGGFLVLGTAILLGGYWAYKTLGWGGYWGWDPVENASLVPWLLGTVLIHGLHMERRKGRYRRANLVFACLLYFSVLYGTFLTRSGVLADFSVHSFVDLGISGWLIGLMAFFMIGGTYLLVTRLRTVPSEPSEDPILSRGSFMVLATVVVGISALVIAVGTSSPLITRGLSHVLTTPEQLTPQSSAVVRWLSKFATPGQVPPSWYNMVHLPIALLIALLLALVPLLSWRTVPAREVMKKLGVGAAVAVALGAVALAAGVRNPLHLLFILLAALALTTNLQKTVQRLQSGGLRSAGGYLAHVGVGVILIGILASSAYDESTKVTLEQGVPRKVEGMTLTFHRFLPRHGDEKERFEVAVVRADGSHYLSYPQLFLNDRTQQVMAHPHITHLMLQDLYISPVEFDPGEPRGGRRLHLRKGEEATVGSARVRFLGFDLNAEGNALQAMREGGIVTVGATLEVVRNGQAEKVEPIYRFTPDGAVDIQPSPLPGGGEVVLAGIDASAGAVQLEVRGLAPSIGPRPKLALDVTRKPLIKLVWYGLYVVLAGGILATSQRLRDAFALERAKV
ncbi:MAG TPA: cytochrome c biogenesis protein CcsA [Thermoanaerobaculia bacterium]|jgi:cytochrome c-type biogenesis protein CcmF|nr:cytochrome c biogenesis protein CcsA [Thermoanaerobaculia bacterium]